MKKRKTAWVFRAVCALVFATSLHAQSSVTAVSVTPNSGSGLTQTFALQYSDSAGANNLASVWVAFSGTASNPAPSSCAVRYVPSIQGIYLEDDTVTSATGVLLGSARLLENSQCSVNPAASSVSLSGNNLTLNLAVTFSSSFIGNGQNIYLRAIDNGGADTGWQLRGAWGTAVVPPPPPPPPPSSSSQVYVIHPSNVFALPLGNGLVQIVSFALPAAGDYMLTFKGVLEFNNAAVGSGVGCYLIAANGNNIMDSGYVNYPSFSPNLSGPGSSSLTLVGAVPQGVLGQQFFVSCQTDLVPGPNSQTTSAGLSNVVFTATIVNGITVTTN